MFYSSINLPSAWCSCNVSSPVFEGKHLLILISPRLPLTGFCQIRGPLKSSGWLVPGTDEWLADWQALNERMDQAYPLLWLTLGLQKLCHFICTTMCIEIPIALSGASTQYSKNRVTLYIYRQVVYITRFKWMQTVKQKIERFFTYATQNVSTFLLISFRGANNLSTEGGWA